MQQTGNGLKSYKNTIGKVKMQVAFFRYQKRLTLKAVHFTT